MTRTQQCHLCSADSSCCGLDSSDIGLLSSYSVAAVGTQDIISQLVMLIDKCQRGCKQVKSASVVQADAALDVYRLALLLVLVMTMITKCQAAGTDLTWHYLAL